MADSALLDQLIDTYKVLNHGVRTMSEDALGLGSPSAREVVRRLRDDELRFSQDLKARVTGQAVSFAETHELPTLGTETEHDSTASLIAQFGTARESTLAMLQSMPVDQWDSTDSYPRSIRAEVEALIERDRQALASIEAVARVSTG